jgi:hypothetical protein
MYSEVTNAFGRIHLDPDLPPSPVLCRVGRVISQHILIPQFESDFVTDILQLIGRLREEGFAAADPRQIFDDGPPALPGVELAASIDDSDYKNLNILFSDEFLNVLKRVPAVVVLSIGYQ